MSVAALLRGRSARAQNGSILSGQRSTIHTSHQLIHSRLFHSNTVRLSITSQHAQLSTKHIHRIDSTHIHTPLVTSRHHSLWWLQFCRVQLSAFFAYGPDGKRMISTQSMTAAGKQTEIKNEPVIAMPSTTTGQPTILLPEDVAHPSTAPTPDSHPPPPSTSSTPAHEEAHSVTSAQAKAAAEAEAKLAEVEAMTFAPIPTLEPDREMPADHTEDSSTAASIPKMPSSDTVIRGTLWFDNMYPMRVHWLDIRYLVATENHNVIIPKLFATVFGIHGFRLIGVTPRANEGGAFVHFEVNRQGVIRTPEDVTKALITLLRAKPVHAWLTPKAVRCHLVRGAPFLDDLASRFPYNRLKIEIKGPVSALQDLTVEQLYNEFSQFGKIFDLVLNPYEKDKPRSGVIQYVRMYSAVGARNCLHRLRLSVPLVVSSLPALVPPKVDDGSSSAVATKPPPPPTAEALLFLTYDSILQTSYVWDFFSKHPRIMVPLLGFLFAAFTYLIFDPLRTFNITNHITQRLSLRELYSMLPGSRLLERTASDIGQAFRRSVGAGGGDESVDVKAELWSARQADEEKVRKWLNSQPDRLLFITGPKGAGKQALVKKLTGGRKNVVVLDISHIIDRTDEEFVKGLAESVGFTPGFALLTWLSNIMDIFTPGASKASGSSTASSAQILKVLECTADALVNIARREQKRIRKEQEKRQRRAARAPQPPPPPAIDETAAKASADKKSATAAQMDKPAPKEKKEAESIIPSLHTITSSITAAVGLGPKTPAATTTTTPPTHPTSGAPTVAATNAPAPATTEALANAPPPTTNTYQPLSTEPIVIGPSSVIPAPVRLNEPPPQPKDESHLTELQKNYQQLMRQQQLQRDQEAENNANAPATSSSSSHHPHQLGTLVEHDPDDLPLFIIDGFNAENAPKHSNFLNVLVNWSSELSTAGVARFIYLTDAALEEQVSKALPEVKMAEVLLSDATPQAAEKFVLNALPEPMRLAVPESQTKAAIQVLGGRYNDLTTLVRGVENGIHPIETVEEIVTQSMNGVKSLLFTDDKNVKWSKVQMWQVLNMLVQSSTGAVLYDDVLFNIFEGDDIPLKSLVRADLLRVEPGLSSGGDRLKAGSPVMNEAFKRLVHQQAKLKPGLDLLVLKYQIGKEQTKINAIEEELVRLAQSADPVLNQQFINGGGSSHLEKGWFTSSPNTSPATYLYNRQQFLIDLLNDSHVKIRGLDEKRRACEKEIKKIKKVE